MSLACAVAVMLFPTAAAAQRQDPQDEIRRLRQRVEALTLELAQIKLEIARDRSRPDHDPDTEASILRDLCLRSEFGSLQRFGMEQAVLLPNERFEPLVPEIAALTRMPTTGAPDSTLMAEAVRTLGRHRDLAPAVAALLELRTHSLVDVRAAVAASLGEIRGDAARPALEELLADSTPQVRLAAIDALAVRGRAGDGVGEILHARLTREEDDAAIEKLLDALGTLKWEAARTDLSSDRCLRHRSERVRWAAINALLRIGDPRDADVVLPFAEPGQPEAIRLISIQALGVLRTDAGRTRLIRLVREESSVPHRDAAVTSLLQFPDEDITATVLLPAYAREADEGVRRTMREGMIRRAADGPAVLTLFDEFLTRGWAPEADELCRSLHSRQLPIDLQAELRPRRARLAATLYDAGNFRGAREHYAELASQIPQAPDDAGALDWVRRALDCHRRTEAVVEALPWLETLIAALEESGDLRAAIEAERLEYLRESGQWVPLAGIAFDLAQRNNSHTAPEELRQKAQRAYDDAMTAIIGSLGSDDEAECAGAVEGLRALERKAILAMAQALAAEGTPPAVRRRLLEIGTSITGIDQDPAVLESADGVGVVVAAWRQWYTQAP